MSTQGSYLTAVQELAEIYGNQLIAKLLGVTERTLMYWTQDRNPKIPTAETQRKIRELFMKHSSGFDITTDLEDQTSVKDKLIAALERENARLQKDLDLSLGELRHNVLLIRAMQETTQEMLSELLAKQRKTKVEEIAADAGKANGEKYLKLKEE